MFQVHCSRFHEKNMEALGIDIKLLIAQIVNFTLFFFLFKRFMAKPFFSYLDKLQKNNQEKEKILGDVKKIEEQAKKNKSDSLKLAREEANKIVSEAKKNAIYQHEEIIKKAHQEAEDIRLKASKQLNDEKNILYSEVKEKLIDTSTLIVKQALRGYLDESQQKELMAKILESDKVYEN